MEYTYNLLYIMITSIPDIPVCLMRNPSHLIPSASMSLWTAPVHPVPAKTTASCSEALTALRTASRASCRNMVVWTPGRQKIEMAKVSELS